MANKLTYRQALYNNVTSKTPSELDGVDFTEFCRDFFFHPVGDQKRLRQYGYKILKRYYPAYAVFWEEKVAPSTIPTKHILWLADNCSQLYYIGSKTIVLFDYHEAVLFKLCDADLEIISETN